MRRAAPRRLEVPLDDLTAALAPASTLARVQAAWERAVGSAVAASAHPTVERDGVLTVICGAAVWTEELTMMESTLLSSLNDALGAGTLRELRCRTGDGP
jgi:predicted nucleic acid-binding Zn ribbon protein